MVNQIFRRPIGTLRDLGTARVWAVEIIGTVICVVALIFALVLL